MTTPKSPLGNYEPPCGTFLVGCVNHRGQGCSAVYPLKEAASLFAQLQAGPGDYPTRARATAKLLRKYLKRRREGEAEALALGALATALASPYADVAGSFSTTVREHNRAAISVVFGKRRGLAIFVAERGHDEAGFIKKATRAGIGPFAFVKASDERPMQ